MARRIIIDSDDDVDDSPPFRRLKANRTANSRNESLAKTTIQKVGRKAQSKTEAEPEVEPKTVIRRRKLGRIDDNNLLLHPWSVDNGKATNEDKGSLTRSFDIDVPPPKLLLDRSAKPHVELRTRRTRRQHSKLADDTGGTSNETPSSLSQSIQEDEKSSDDDDDDEASEFRVSSSDEDLSLESLGDFFPSPAKNRTITHQPRLQAPKEANNAAKRADQHAPSASQNRGSPNPYTEEASSVFFSAEESLIESLANPMSQLNLEAPIPKPTSPKPAKASRAALPSRPTTPPPAHPQKQNPSALVSPTKKLPRIPKTPHQPSTDAFWDQELVDDWNTQHSPRKLLFDPDAAKRKTSAASSPLKKGIAAVEKKEAKKLFQKSKHEMAETFLAELDSTITHGELGRLAAATGGVNIVWTNKLNTTAGRANWRRETLRPRKPPKTADMTSEAAATDEVTNTLHVLHHASIELAEKVIDDEQRLLNVIAHEFCHLANFMVSGVTGNPHGKEFKVWAAACSKHFGDRGIVVTTKHSYEIDFKYIWTCTECAAEFKRHSKSIDPARHRCGACRGPLQQTKPIPRGAGRAGGTASSAPVPSAYQKFMKEQMAVMRLENPGSPQKDIMKMVADKWTRAKQQKGVGTTTESKSQAKDKKDSAVDHLDKAFVDLTLN